MIVVQIRKLAKEMITEFFLKIGVARKWLYQVGSFNVMN